MDHKNKPVPDPEPRPLGNESTDPFSPTLPPGSLHERLYTEQDEGSNEDDEGDKKKEQRQ